MKEKRTLKSELGFIARVVVRTMIVVLAIIGGASLWIIERGTSRFDDTVKFVEATRIPAGQVTNFPLYARPWDTKRAERVLASPRLAQAERWIYANTRLHHGFKLIVGACHPDVAPGVPYGSHSRQPPEVVLCLTDLAETERRLGGLPAYLDLDGIHRAALDDAALFIILHELGHVVIHDTDVPVLGREEDAADAFATVVAVRIGHPEIVQGGMALFSDGQSTGAAMDVHTPHIARAGYLACLLDGSDPKARERFMTAVDDTAAKKIQSDCVRAWAVTVRAFCEVFSSSAFSKGTCPRWSRRG